MTTREPWGPLKRLIELFDEHKFGTEELQNLVENADVLLQIGRGDIPRLDLIEGMRAVRNHFYIDEEVESQCGYPSGWKLRPVADQIAILKEHFPGLEYPPVEEIDDALDLAAKLGPLPAEADGWGVVPQLFRLGDSYHQALERILARLQESRRFLSSPGGDLGPEYLRPTERLSIAWTHLSRRAGDVVILPVQLGIRHRGRSVRRARVMFAGDEWGLGPFEVACILLTHPKRLCSLIHLGIDCAGSLYDLHRSNRFEGLLAFSVLGEKRLMLSTAEDSDINPRFGSATAFDFGKW